MSICRWTAEETDDNVTGAGAESWEWYRSEIEQKGDRYEVVMDDPNGDTPVTYTFTRARVRTVVTEIAMGKHNVANRIRNYIKADDLDADAMDCVIQIIVYGEVVFG